MRTQKEKIKDFFEKNPDKITQSSFEIAKLLGCTAKYVRDVRREYFGSFTKKTKTEKIKNVLKENPNISDREVAAMFGTTRRFVCDIRNDLISNNKVQEYKIVGNKFVDKTAKELWSAFSNKSKEYVESVKKEKNATIEFYKNKPIAIAFIGDNHIGNDASNYSKMEEDAKIINNTDNFYAILCGDMLDNHIMIQEAMISSNSSPKLQWKLFKYYIDMFKNKILCSISGNHEYWSKKISGLDLLENYFKGIRILYGSHSYLLEIKFPNNYNIKIKVRHKFRFNSSDNLTHTVKKLLKEGNDDFDVGVIAHHHQAEITKFFYKNKERIAIRTGTYLLYDTYADKVGFENFTNNMPVVIINPVSNSLSFCWDIKEAEEIIKTLNSKRI